MKPILFSNNPVPGGQLRHYRLIVEFLDELGVHRQRGGPHRIEVDIAGEPKQVIVTLHQGRFVTTTEEVSDTLVLGVVVDGIGRVELRRSRTLPRIHLIAIGTYGVGSPLDDCYVDHMSTHQRRISNHGLLTITAMV